MQTSVDTPRGLSGRRRAWHWAVRAAMYLSAGATCALTLGLIGYILWRGVPGLSWEFLTTQESILKGTDGILPAIQNTLYVILVTLVIVLPLGVGAAVYLTEYATNRRLTEAIEFATETLAGIPSILYALVGMLVFCQFCDLGTTLLAGSLTLVIMTLPTIIRTLTVALYVYAKERYKYDNAFSVAVVLLALTLLINLAAGAAGKRAKREEER